MPGVDFGPNGEGYVRFCFARDRKELTGALEAHFGSLSKTLFFEYQTLAELARYFARAHAGRLRQVLKSLLRSYHFRCLEIAEVKPDEPGTSSVV